MVIIVGAGANLSELAELASAYDRSQDYSEREEIAAEAYGLIGGQIRGMIRHRARGLRLTEEQLEALAWEAILRGLNESGMTRFRLAHAPDSDWQPVIQNMMEAAKTDPSGPQSRIWGMLSPEAKSAVMKNPKYITYLVQSTILSEINGLLRRRNLYDPAAWSGIQLPDEARILLQRGGSLSGTEMSRLNAVLISSAFPALTVPPPPKKNLLGYISATVVPRMQPEIYETATGRASDQHLADALAFLRPDIEAVRRMEAQGTLPEGWERLSPAERIFRHQKRRIEQRYGPVIGWWNSRIRELQPGNPYVVSNSGSLQSARKLFQQHPEQVPERFWKTKDAQYNLPSQALAPFGLGTIERLLASESFNRNTSKGVQPQVAPIYTRPESGDIDAARLLAGGHSSKAYRHLVMRLFAPGQAEYRIGMFLASNPSPNQQQIVQFLQSLPPDIGDDIEAHGWHRTVFEIDQRVLEAVRNPEMRAELVRVLGDQQAVVALLSIRRHVFCRTAAYVRKQAG